VSLLLRYGAGDVANCDIAACSATTGGCDNSGRGSNGGVWEWTMTPFATHEGLVPTDHFTGYVPRFMFLFSFSYLSLS
jgi:hypothetical protein